MYMYTELLSNFKLVADIIYHVLAVCLIDSLCIVMRTCVQISSLFLTMFTYDTSVTVSIVMIY